jgi:hypothetical protein
VCKYWREVTLSNPLLWEYLASYYPPSVVEITLQRSKKLPLRVYIEQCGPDFVDLVQPHVTSIKHLVCDFPQPVYTTRQPHPLVVISPILESLELRRCQIADGNRILSVSDSPQYTTIARISLTASLKHLSLFFTPLTNHLVDLTTLTKVTLQGIVTPFDTFLRFLGNNTHLEEIRVADILLEEVDLPGETISLPHLNKFSYCGHGVYPFLHRLSAPQCTQFSLTFTDPIENSAQILQDVLPTSLEPLGIPSIDLVSLKMDHPSSVASICDSKGAGIHLRWLNEEPSAETIDWHFSNLHTVREVCLSISPTMDPSPTYLRDIDTLLRRTSRSDTLSLLNRGGIYESQVLSMITSRSLLPSLNKLRFSGPAQGFPLKELIDFVEARKEDMGVSDIRQVDVLIEPGESVSLEELETLVDVDVKTLDSWTVPGGWERGW